MPKTAPFIGGRTTLYGQPHDTISDIDLVRILREREQQTGLTVAQRLVLWVLKEHGPMRMGEVADRADIGGSTLTLVTDTLERKGLIARERSETDARSIILRRTTTV